MIFAVLFRFLTNWTVCYCCFYWWKSCFLFVLTCFMNLIIKINRRSWLIGSRGDRCLFVNLFINWWFLLQLVGGPCGQHGPYTFYKAFKYAKNGVKRIVTLSEFFFVKLWIDSDLLCIGELQLLWSDKNSDQVLASLRLYFLPENTPEGRMDHGEVTIFRIKLQ